MSNKQTKSVVNTGTYKGQAVPVADKTPPVFLI